MEIVICQMKVQEIRFMIFKCNVDNKRKKAIRCSGAYNTFDCMIWDTYRMSSEQIVIEFSSNSHRNYLFSNLLSTTIVDKGQYNVCKSTYEESLRIQLPITLNKPHLIGNQDDILVNAQQKYTIKQVSGKVPYGESRKLL